MVQRQTADQRRTQPRPIQKNKTQPDDCPYDDENERRKSAEEKIKLNRPVAGAVFCCHDRSPPVHLGPFLRLSEQAPVFIFNNNMMQLFRQHAKIFYLHISALQMCSQGLCPYNCVIKKK